MRLLLDIFVQMLRTIWAHKLRSCLTMCGIAWGVGSLLLLVGLGEGFRSGNQRNMRDLGENVMFIWSGRAPAVQGSFTGLRQYYLNDKDYEDIRRECPDVGQAVPLINRGDLRSVSDFNSTGAQVMGTLPPYNKIRNMPLKSGRWINDGDVEQ